MLAINLPTFVTFGQAIRYLLELADRNEDYFVAEAEDINDFLIHQFDDEDLTGLTHKYIIVKRSDLVVLPVDPKSILKIIVVRPDNQIHILQTTGEKVWGFPINTLVREIYHGLTEVKAFDSDFNRIEYT